MRAADGFGRRFGGGFSPLESLAGRASLHLPAYVEGHKEPAIADAVAADDDDADDDNDDDGDDGEMVPDLVANSKLNVVGR